MRGILAAAAFGAAVCVAPASDASLLFDFAGTFTQVDAAGSPLGEPPVSFEAIFTFTTGEVSTTTAATYEGQVLNLIFNGVDYGSGGSGAIGYNLDDTRAQLTFSGGVIGPAGFSLDFVGPSRAYSIPTDGATYENNVQADLARGFFKGYTYSGLTGFSATVTGSAPEPSFPPPAVPEPATWAMLIAGFCLIGGMARRRRLAYAA